MSNPLYTTPTDNDGWNLLLTRHGFHVKWHNEPERPNEKYPSSQLEYLQNSYTKKKAFFGESLNDNLQKVADGLDSDGLAQLNIDAYYKFDMFLTLVQKEIELREAGLIVREPVGTTYYVDYVNGNDANDGLTVGNSKQNFRPLITSTALTPGDKIILRRNSTVIDPTANSQITDDGTPLAPLIFEADYDDSWGDFSNSAQTYTAVIGSLTMEASDTISGISAGDWVYVTGDDAREHCLEVESVSGTTLTFYTAYKGENAGSGKTLVVMGPNPRAGDGIGGSITGKPVSFYHGVYWEVNGVDFDMTHFGSGHYYSGGQTHVIIRNCYLKGNNISIRLDNSTSDAYTGTDVKIFKKCRLVKTFTNTGVVAINYQGGGRYVLEDCIIDLADLYQASGIYTLTNTSDLSSTLIKDCKFINVEGGGQQRIFEVSQTTNGVMPHNGILKFENPIIDGTPQYGFLHSRYNSPSSLFGRSYAVAVTNYNGVAGDNRIYASLGFRAPAYYNAPIVLQSSSSVVRTGGAASSLKVTPLAADYIGFIDLIGPYVTNTLKSEGLPIYLSDTTQKTITFYVKAESGEFVSNNPTADHLYIEVEYYNSSSNLSKSVKRSTSTVDFVGSTDWQPLTVTFTPGQTGIAHVRVKYGLNTSVYSSNGNQYFYFDPYINIS